MSSNLSFSTRILAVILQSRMGRVRALERALRLQGVMRFIGVATGSIIFPAIVLAYFGLSSIKDQEQDSISDMEEIAQDVALAFLQEINSETIGFEQTIQAVLESGQMPLRLVHKEQRIAFCFDRDQQMLAPFIERTETLGVDVLFHPAYQQNKLVSKMDSRTKDNVLYKRLRRAIKENKIVKIRYLSTLLKSSPHRHVNGARIKHLVQLHQLEQEDVSFSDFSGIMEDILAEPWVIGEGIDAQVAIKTLMYFEQGATDLTQREKAYLGNTHLRIEERMETLFWASRWEYEWRDVIAQPRQTQPGALLWQTGDIGLWARTSWKGDSYVFGFDKNKMIEQLKKTANSNTMHQPLVSIVLLAPQEISPAKMLTRRYIPWLEGWSIAVLEQDISSLEQASDNIRRQKLLVIGMSIFLMVIGGYLSVRVTLNELNTADIKSNFAASISHEIRSPITQIRLKGEALLFDLVEEDELQEHYESIVRESERLSWLVDNVLDYAVLERDSRSYLFREGDLNKVITRVVESVSSTLTMRDVHLELHLDPNLPKLRFDANGVSQCLINLINNAEKYSKEEKWISVSTRREVEGIEVRVSDRGIGISKEDSQDIFAPFFRSKEKEAIRRKGTGIGLSIVQTIILAHGGQVLVQSQLGKGSSFILQFPNELIVEGEENV